MNAGSIRTALAALCLSLSGALASCYDDSREAAKATSAPAAASAAPRQGGSKAPSLYEQKPENDTVHRIEELPTAPPETSTLESAPMPKKARPAAAAPPPGKEAATKRGHDDLYGLGGDAEDRPAEAAARRAEDDKRRAAEARRTALARAAEKDRAHRDDERLPLVPHHDGDDRFAGLRVLRNSSVPDMVFHDYGVNPTISVRDESVSTFAVDVDSASYNVARSYLQRGVMPEEAAIRVEEMINVFDYAYTAPTEEPFLVQAEAFPSPNRKGYHVLHVGLKGRDVGIEQRKPTMLAFVVDVSGSMEGENRLGLVQRSLTLLTRNLDGRDTVAIVVYGSTARVALEPTRATESGKRQIIDVLSALSTEGSTNVEAGLVLGYDMVGRQAGAGVTSRVILCSDGVANTGATEAEAILRRVEEQAARGVTISTVGFGMGTYNDVLMERLADKGNGNYAYIDTLEAAQRVFVDQLGATLDVIAKDVKLQVAFDDRSVERYRLLGFENRMLDKRDFSNDHVDAGELGAGHTVTAIYEVKLRSPAPVAPLAELRVRYKDPSSATSRLLAKAVPGAIVRGSFAEASAPTKLSVVVAAFAEKLRGSYWARNESYDDILALWDDLPDSLRRRQDVAELRTLVATARTLDRRGDRFEALLPVAKMDFDRVPVLY